MSWVARESYPAKGTAGLAQLLWDTGLLAQVNAAVLHPQGLALGVDVVEGRVLGLEFFRSDDSLGLCFDEAATDTYRDKMRRAGLLLSPPQDPEP